MSGDLGVRAPDDCETLAGVRPEMGFVMQTGLFGPLINWRALHERLVYKICSDFCLDTRQK